MSPFCDSSKLQGGRSFHNNKKKYFLGNKERKKKKKSESSNISTTRRMNNIGSNMTHTPCSHLLHKTLRRPILMDFK